MRACRGKHRYRDHQEAIDALHHVQAKSVRARVPRRTYYCGRCKGFHLTAQEKR